MHYLQYCGVKGFKCLTAQGMDEAFAILESRNDVGIILIDIMMPGMDGYEAIPKLTSVEKFKQVPVIAVTAQAMRGDRERCLTVGADDYLSKPVDVDLLLKTLNEKLK